MTGSVGQDTIWRFHRQTPKIVGDVRITYDNVDRKLTYEKESRWWTLKYHYIHLFSSFILRLKNTQLTEWTYCGKCVLIACYRIQSKLAVPDVLLRWVSQVSRKGNIIWLYLSSLTGFRCICRETEFFFNMLVKTVATLMMWIKESIISDQYISIMKVL